MNTDKLKTELTLLTNFASKQARLHAEGKPVEGNVTDEENKYLAILASEIEKVTTAARIDERKSMDADLNGKTFSDETDWRQEYDRIRIKNTNRRIQLETLNQKGAADE